SVFRSILRHLGTPLTYFLPLFFLAVLLPIMRFPQVIAHRIGRGLEIALIIVFAWMLIQAINIARDIIINRFDVKKDDNLRERKIRTQLQFIRRILVAFIVGLTIAAVLLTFSSMRKIGTGLLTGVGVGGIIIGFAAQRSLGNLLAGMQIAFTQPIRIDDAVIVEGEFGWIEDITLTYVVVRIWDERRLILPINYFIEKPFQNWTRSSSQLLGSAFVYADYSLPVEEVRKELTRLLHATPLWDGRANGLAVTNLTDRTIEMRAVMSARNAGHTFDLRCYVRENLIAFIRKNYPESLPKTRSEVLGSATIAEKGQDLDV
ncbi:MAG: mechanosensitive ion channel family protein, partial [Chitinophagaceae bacterium]